MAEAVKARAIVEQEVAHAAEELLVDHELSDKAYRQLRSSFGSLLPRSMTGSPPLYWVTKFTFD